MAKNKTPLTTAQKHQKLANILVSFYGMKERTDKAQRFFNRRIRAYGATRADIAIAMPMARQIIKERTKAFKKTTKEVTLGVE